jgi:hypothetical integral membrane protein (TIGR02206 family)
MMPRAIVRAIPDQWEQFGVQHLMALLIVAVLCANLLTFRREIERARPDIWIVLAMVGVHLAWLTFARGTGLAAWTDLLPLYTCDAAIVAGVVWCRWKPTWLGHVLFYWSFVGGGVTLLLPDTFGYALPHPAVAYTLVFHALLLLLGLEIWVVEGVRPRFRSLAPVMLATAVLVPPALVANAAFESDYMFVSRDPGGIFTFLTEFEGAARVAATLLSGSGLLVVGLLVWTALDAGLRAWERRLATLASVAQHVRLESGAPAGQ